MWSVSAVDLPAHFQNRVGVRKHLRAFLRQRNHLAVVDRHEARGPHQVGLANAPLPQFRRVALEAEECPVEIEGMRSARHQLAHGERIRLLLHDDVGEDRLHHHRGVAAEFAHRLDQPRIVQLQVFAEVDHFERGLVDACSPLRLSRTAWRPVSSISTAERWSSRNSPKVMRKT